MNTSFANSGYMGIPLVITALGEEAALPAIIGTAFMNIVFISLTIALVETGESKKVGAIGIGRDVAAALIKNPLIVPVVVGVMIPAFGLKLPAPLEAFCDLLGNAAGPCALFAIGLFLAGQSVREDLGQVSVLVFLKLIVHPLITWLLVTHVFVLEWPWATATILMSALPTGVNCFVLAQRYRVFVAPTSSTILLSTMLSVITVSLLLVVLRIS